MTSIINSKAVFVDYATAAGVTQASIDVSVAGGIDTMSKLAFSSSYVPGQDSDAAFKEFLQALLGNAPNVGQFACWRQLHFTSHTQCSSGPSAGRQWSRSAVAQYAGS